MGLKVILSLCLKEWSFVVISLMYINSAKEFFLQKYIVSLITDNTFHSVYVIGRMFIYCHLLWAASILCDLIFLKGDFSKCITKSHLIFKKLSVQIRKKYSFYFSGHTSCLLICKTWFQCPQSIDLYHTRKKKRPAGVGLSREKNVLVSEMKDQVPKGETA